MKKTTRTFGKQFKVSQRWSEKKRKFLIKRGVFSKLPKKRPRFRKRTGIILPICHQNRLSHGFYSTLFLSNSESHIPWLSLFWWQIGRIIPVRLRKRGRFLGSLLKTPRFIRNFLFFSLHRWLTLNCFPNVRVVFFI